MRILFADFETYWDNTHSLSKMNPIVYCLHPKTEIISLAVKEMNSPNVHVLFGEADLRDWCNKQDWSDVMLVGHNMSGFDSMLFAWRLGVRPKMWGCTLSMARPFFGLTVGVSLKKVAGALGLGEKGDLEATNTKGKHLSEFSEAELAAMREYNKQDVVLCEGIFKKLVKKTPTKELYHIDAVTRMLVEPKFHVDVPLLEKTLQEERDRKRLILLDLATMLGEYHAGMEEEEATNVVSKTLGSAPKFGRLLKDLGVEVPQKISPTTGKLTPALAKTDEGFLALQNHPDPLVAAAVNARLGVKSTLLESRVESFLEVAKATGGKMPVPQQYYAAHTGRNGGGGASLNLCNLPRVAGKPSDALRNSLIAPPGHKVIVADLSGIELRVNHFLWKVPSSMALFQADPAKADLYKTFASTLYGVPVEEVSKLQRQVAKVAQLGLGYGAGPRTFQRVAKLMGGVDLSDGECEDIVYKWRDAYVQIVQGWKISHAILPVIAQGVETDIDPWGLLRTDSEGIILPSGRKIRYPGLHLETSDDGKKEWWYGEGRNRARIYAGRVVENIVQALSRDVFKDCLLEIKRRTGIYPAHEVYDELVYIVPEGEAESMLATVLEVMRTPPTWWPELMVWAEGDIADSYGAAK